MRRELRVPRGMCYNLRRGEIRDMCMFNAVIHAEKNGEWWAEVPALPGCYAMGQSRAEVCANVREAIAMHLEELSKDDVPEGAELERVAL